MADPALRSSLAWRSAQVPFNLNHPMMLPDFGHRTDFPLPCAYDAAMASVTSAEASMAAPNSRPLSFLGSLLFPSFFPTFGFTIPQSAHLDSINRV